MNWKLPSLLIITLVLGVGLGYVVSYGIYQPQVSKLSSEKTDLQMQVNDLQVQVHDLYDDVIPLKMLSGSMTPTINLSDIVLISPISNVSEIKTGYDDGDIIAFNRPGDSAVIVIHRAVEKHADGETWYFKSKGDNNNSADYWKIYGRDIIGIVGVVIPTSAQDN